MFVTLLVWQIHLPLAETTHPGKVVFEVRSAQAGLLPRLRLLIAEAFMFDLQISLRTLKLSFLLSFLCY